MCNLKSIMQTLQQKYYIHERQFAKRSPFVLLKMNSLFERCLHVKDPSCKSWKTVGVIKKNLLLTPDWFFFVSCFVMPLKKEALLIWQMHVPEKMWHHLREIKSLTAKNHRYNKELICQTNSSLLFLPSFYLLNWAAPFCMWTGPTKEGKWFAPRDRDRKNNAACYSLNKKNAAEMRSKVP